MAQLGVNGQGGAYGLAISGLTDATVLLHRYPSDWPAVTVRQITATPALEPARIRASRAEIPLLGGGRALLDREDGSVTFLMPLPLAEDELLHPFLAAPAEIFALWLGRRAFHAGAFASENGAWAVLGDKFAGKSTLLGQLARIGVPIVTDDILIVQEGMCLAGPRCIDLRRGAAARLPHGGRMIPARSGQRWRLALGDVEARIPLRGWVSLQWGDTVAMRRLRPTERLQKLAEHGGARPDALLELARLPAWELRRPRSWEQLGDVADRLLDVVDGEPG